MSMRKDNSGFTMIEFAISNLATMVMLGATFTLLNSIFAANAGMGEIMQTQQNIRVAINTITRDITMAGTGLPNGGIAVPNGGPADALMRPGAGGTMATPNNTIAILAPGDGAGPTVNNIATDALTITQIDQQSPVWTVLSASTSGIQIDFVQNVRAGTMQLFTGDLLVLTNANGSALGCVTSVSMTTSRAFFADNDPMNINQPDAANGNIKSIANGDGTYPPTTAQRFNLVTYYINNDNAVHPRLMRALNAQAPQVIVDDIENLQFAFDLFDFQANSGNSNQATTTSPNQIRSVSVSLTGRSPSVMQRSNKYFRFSLVSEAKEQNSTFRNRYTGS